MDADVQAVRAARAFLDVVEIRTTRSAAGALTTTASRRLVAEVVDSPLAAVEQARDVDPEGSASPVSRAHPAIQVFRQLQAAADAAVSSEAIAF